VRESADPVSLSIPLKQFIAARAASIWERKVALETQIDPVTGGQANQEATAIVRSWSLAFSRGDEDAFARRLSWEGFNVETASRAVAGSPVVPVESLPPWIGWLDRILRHTPDVLCDFTAGTLEETEARNWSDEPPFVELWVAPLRAARQELIGRIQESAWKRATMPALRALDQQVMREMSYYAGRAVLELFRESLTLTAGSVGDRIAASSVPPDSYRAFVVAMIETGLATLWITYPVLARQIAVVLECWVGSTAELLQRLDADWTGIASCFAGDGDLGPVTWVDPALSDPHHGRRRVVALGFRSGLQIVYKPRDLGLDRTFNDLLAWATARGLPFSLRTLRVLERDGYGWVEFVRHETLPTHEHARACYRQCGSLLCLAHVLRGKDLHMENLVVTSDGPVLVDVEPLLQPVRKARHSEIEAGESFADAHPSKESCLATGLLSMFEIGPDGQIFDVGGLRGAGTGVLTMPRLAWKGLRSADVHFVEETTFAAPVSNRVSVQGDAQHAEAYTDEILAGFAATYRWLLTHRDHLLQPTGLLAAFGRYHTRVIPRSTNQYAMLGAVLATPRYQRDGARRSAAMDILLRPFSGERSRPAIWDALVAERRALEDLDVPYFWVPCDRVEVYAGDQPVVHNHFSQSGLSAVRDVIDRLSDADLARQLSILTRALSESPRSRFVSRFVASQPVSELSDPTLDSFIDHAIWIANELQHRATLGPHGGICWPRDSIERSSDVCPHGLYDGTVGVALFFGALHLVTGNSRWAEASRAALAPLWRSIARCELTTWTSTGIGVGDGLGSVVYALAWLGLWLDDQHCGDAAVEIAAILAERIDQDRHDDVLSGAAGGILALLALDRVKTDNRLLAWADACGARLVSRKLDVDDGSAWPTADGRRLVGFAHGAAGIAYALDRLFRETGTKSVGEAARRGFRFEQRQYLADEGNWPVADAASDPSAAVTAMTAWCHGAPGVALVNALGGIQSAGELEAALATSARWMPGRGDYLCCGTLGRSEALLTIGRHLDCSPVVAAGIALAGQVIERARRVDHFRLGLSPFEYRVFDPGFFRGLSGIGYTLLRLAAPSRLPSVLAFEAPSRLASAEGEI
jgi:type 2 lantibiotic biosynthesis protein LanM